MSCSKASWNMAVSCCLSQVHCARLSWFCKDLCTSVLRLYRSRLSRKNSTIIVDLNGTNCHEAWEPVSTSFTLCYVLDVSCWHNRNKAPVFSTTWNSFASTWLGVKRVWAFSPRWPKSLGFGVWNLDPWPMSSARSPSVSPFNPRNVESPPVFPLWSLPSARPPHVARPCRPSSGTVDVAWISAAPGHDMARVGTWQETRDCDSAVPRLPRLPRPLFCTIEASYTCHTGQVAHGAVPPISALAISFQDPRRPWQRHWRAWTPTRLPGP